MYADYTYYANEYLCGKTAQVSEKEFLFWEKQARKEIDLHTFNRLKNENSIREEVKDCVCAIAELLYKANKVSEDAAAQGLAGPLVQWNNDGNSGSVDLSQSVYSESGKKTEIKRLVRTYLAHTGLLYAGVSCCEP